MKIKYSHIFKNIFIFLSIIIILVYTLFPFFVAISTALKTKPEIYGNTISWLPKKITFSNFIGIWKQINFARYLLNSLVVCIGTSFFTFVSATMAAYALANMKFKLKKLYLNLILLTQMFSPIVLIIPLFVILSNIKLSNNLLGLIILDTAVVLPFTIWLAYGFFKSFPKEILEAAEIDGCGKFSSLIRIIFPIIKPGLVTIIIYTFAFAWNEFLFAYTIITKSKIKVVSVGIFDFVRMYNADWNYITSALLVAIIPIFILFLLIEKNVVKGLSEGMGK